MIKLYTFVKNFIYKFVEEGMSYIASEKFGIRHRLSNVILMAAFLGGLISLIITALSPEKDGIISIAVILLVVAMSLYISIICSNSTLAGLLICIFANGFVFPNMFFKSGGLNSGMPVWFVLGLICTWLLLDGIASILMFIMNLMIMTGCMYYSVIHPESVVAVSDQFKFTDILQSIIVVSCIFGAIFKYQTFVYESQRRQLEEHQKELMASNDAKTRFLANMSHEIRTPINGIIGMDSMLLREYAHDETVSEYARNIEGASKALLSIINDILDISKIESGKVELVSGEYLLFDILLDCYNMNQSRMQENALDFIIDINPRIPRSLYGDSTRIRQIMNNLLSNACKYTKKGYVLFSVDYEKLDEDSIMLTFSVKDTGIGIKSEDIDKLFEDFTRLEENRNRNIEGTGLGLNLTKAYTEMMGGTVSVHSIYNQGSTFIVNLPQKVISWDDIGDFKDNYDKYMAMDIERLHVPYAPSANILVVDDVPMNLLVARGILKQSTMNIDTAENGPDSLELVCKKKYDIIFLDHMMPNMDGVETLHRMKALKDSLNIDTPVIVITANAISGAREEYLNAGFDDYISKPVREEELFRILWKYLPEELVEERIEIADSGDDVISRNSSITDGRIDVKTGLMYCLDDVDFYNELIQEYIRVPRLEDMTRYYEAKDLENYRITVHSMKGTSLTIGAVTLSEHFKELEMACKRNDYDYILKNHSSVYEEYEDMLSFLASFRVE